MKRSLCFNLLCVGLAVVLAGATSGCRTKRPDKGVTLIRGTPSPDIKGPGPMTADAGRATPPSAVDTTPIPVAPPATTTPVAPPPIETSTTGIGLAPADSIFGMIPDAAAFAPNTVHFAYDSASIASKEMAKIKEVAVVLRGQPANKVVIDGHCDERGTEEYNRALGERRALSIREYLVKKEGITPDRIYTRTFGKDKPASLGHDEGARSQNRRGEFILLRPPTGVGARTP